MLGDDFPAALEAATEGNEEAFALIWRSSHPVLLRYLRVIAGNLAEDAASDVWLKALRSLNSFHGDERGFQHWLIAIAHNHVRDLARRRMARPETLVGKDPRFEHLTVADAAEAVLEQRSTDAALLLVATLPPAQAQMVALRVLIGMDVAEVAEIVGRSRGAVRVSVHRGLKTLAGRLRGDGQQHPPPRSLPPADDAQPGVTVKVTRSLSG